MAHTMTAAKIMRNPTTRRRFLVGMSAGPFSCIAGNIIASYYFGSELKTAGIRDSDQQLKANVVLNAWCLVCCLAGTHLAAKAGRKTTALLSQFLLIVCLYIIGGLTKKYSENPDGASSSLVYGNVDSIAISVRARGDELFNSSSLSGLFDGGTEFAGVCSFQACFFSLDPRTHELLPSSLVLTFVMPIGLGNIGWKMYIINASWDVVTFGLIVSIFTLHIILPTLERLTGCRRISGSRQRVARWRKSMPYSRARTVFCTRNFQKQASDWFKCRRGSRNRSSEDGYLTYNA